MPCESSAAAVCSASDGGDELLMVTSRSIYMAMVSPDTGSMASSSASTVTSDLPTSSSNAGTGSGDITSVLAAATRGGEGPGVGGAHRCPSKSRSVSRCLKRCRRR